MKAPTSLPAVTSYIRALLRTKDWDKLIEVLEYLDSYENDWGTSHLVKAFSDAGFVWDVGPACRAKGCPSFVIDALELSLQDVEKSGNQSRLIRKLLVFGDFYHDFYDQNDKAIRWWDEAIARIADADPAVQREFADDKVVYTNKLARLYFDGAVRNFEGNTNYLSSLDPYSSSGGEEIMLTAPTWHIKSSAYPAQRRSHPAKADRAGGDIRAGRRGGRVLVLHAGVPVAAVRAVAARVREGQAGGVAGVFPRPDPGADERPRRRRPHERHRRLRKARDEPVPGGRRGAGQRYRRCHVQDAAGAYG